MWLEVRNTQWLLTLGGVILTLVCVIIANEVSGGGHSNDYVMYVFFPYAMLLPANEVSFLNVFFFVLLAIQFPLYGWAIGVARARNLASALMLCILTAHVVAVALCFILAAAR